MVESLNAIQYEIALSHVPNIGPARRDKLNERFGTVEAAWGASERQLAQVLDSRSLHSLIEVRGQLCIEGTLARIRNLGARVLVRSDPAYPELLKRLPYAPFVLYVLGDVDLLASRAVAVVGTRKASVYGLRAARRLGGDLARSGVTIVSGMAMGIDTAAHRAALDVSGATIAVLGCGQDVPYPRRNQALRTEIVSEGALVSEYPPGTPPTAGNFPARNRIISGLSLATLVVEAGTKSGALITARYAADHGRDVFAVPGSIFSQGHAGANGLIGAGAGVALAASDLLTALDLSHLAVPDQKRRPEASTSVERGILSALSGEPMHIDEVGRAAGLSSVEIARVLALMELRGLVENTGGMRWVAAI